MKLYLKSEVQEKLRNRAADEIPTIADLKLIVDYIDEIERDLYFREENLQYLFELSRREWNYVRQEVATHTNLAELIRERIFPLHKAITGESLPKRNFDPAHFENLE